MADLDALRNIDTSKRSPLRGNGTARCERWPQARKA
jgi:hypothetical protein